MIKIVIVNRNENNKIELTKEELTNLLNETYLDGYKEGVRNPAEITYIDANSITLKNIKNGKGLEKI